MKIRTRQTPCLGVCSTTYGDLVCRGCKRFSHEITGWNGFDSDQKKRVWQRLEILRDQCVALRIGIFDSTLLHAEIQCKNIPVWESSSDLTSAYQLLRFFARMNPRLLHREVSFEDKLRAMGLSLVESEITGTELFVAEGFTGLCRWIDDEFYKRSRAFYERNFKIPLLD